jgi:hypothetical protein
MRPGSCPQQAAPWFILPFVAFYNKRGTCEQGDAAFNRTHLHMAGLALWQDTATVISNRKCCYALALICLLPA